MLFALFAAASCSREDGAPSVRSGQAPDFTLSDIGGGAVSLSSLRGRVVLVDFWATWCPPCRESIPELNALYGRYKDRGLVVLGVSVDRGLDLASTVGAFARDNGLTYPVLLDDKGVNKLYSVSSIPAMFLIDKEGKVAKRFVGYSPGLGETISKEIEALL